MAGLCSRRSCAHILTVQRHDTAETPRRFVATAHTLSDMFCSLAARVCLPRMKGEAAGFPVFEKKRAEGRRGASAVNQTQGELRKQGRVQFSQDVLYAYRLGKSETISVLRYKMYPTAATNGAGVEANALCRGDFHNV